MCPGKRQTVDSGSEACSSMPSAKAKRASKPVSRWAAGCNARGKKRRNAVKLLNALADEVFLKTVPVKAPAARVEALVRKRFLSE